MKAALNGHSMIRVSPGRYECLRCAAMIVEVEIAANGWHSSKSGNLCPGERVGLPPRGKSQTVHAANPF